MPHPARLRAGGLVEPKCQRAAPLNRIAGAAAKTGEGMPALAGRKALRAHACAGGPVARILPQHASDASSPHSPRARKRAPRESPRNWPNSLRAQSDLPSLTRPALLLGPPRLLIRKHVSSTGLEGDSRWVLAALRTEVDAGVLVKPGGSTASYKFAPGGK